MVNVNDDITIFVHIADCTLGNANLFSTFDCLHQLQLGIRILICHCKLAETQNMGD